MEVSHDRGEFTLTIVLLSNKKTIYFTKTEKLDEYFLFDDSVYLPAHKLEAVLFLQNIVLSEYNYYWAPACYYSVLFKQNHKYVVLKNKEVNLHFV